MRNESLYRGPNSTLFACYPYPSFPAVSITGETCALSCKHCGRRYLRKMIACSSPDDLFKTCLDLVTNGARGVLLSGGYNSEGYVPFEQFVDVIERVKQETGLLISAHTGLMPAWLIRELAGAGLDAAFFDVVGSDETIRLVFGVEKTVEDYRRTLENLRKELQWLAPHICIGLHEGKIVGEFKALEIASAVDIDVLVFLIFTPTANTPFKKFSPPSQEDVGEVIGMARAMFPGIPLTLGCMRPKSTERVEIELVALNAGIDRIEIPSRQTLEVARIAGLCVKKMNTCCGAPIKSEIEGWDEKK